VGRKPRRSAEAEALERALYNTPTWRKVSKAVLFRDRYRCQARLDSRCRGRATIAHHIRAVRDGGTPYDMANLQAICAHCHGVLTVREQRRRKARTVSTRRAPADPVGIAIY
jgi:5-methylcytosine-specific restriction endonuclease McrA